MEALNCQEIDKINMIKKKKKIGVDNLRCLKMLSCIKTILYKPIKIETF